MNRQEEILRECSYKLKQLRKECLDSGMNEEEFKKIYLESIHNLQNETSRTPNPRRSHTFMFKMFLIVTFTITCAYNYRSIYTYVVCNIQEYIYPGLRIWRKISIPFISLFPSLIDLHQSSCLVQNPYFTISDMDCWPCSNVQNVREIENPNPSHRQLSAPFIYQTQQKKVSLHDLQDLYTRNKNTFDSETSKVIVNKKHEMTPKEMFEDSIILKDKNLYIWKINTINSARILRQIVPRPKIVPKFGQSSERFIIIDTLGINFPVPDTECNYSFLVVLNGKRSVVLKPAEECKHQCRSLKIDVSESYLLSYNWWYWRPAVLQKTHNETFIAQVGSYC